MYQFGQMSFRVKQVFKALVYGTYQPGFRLFSVRKLMCNYAVTMSTTLFEKSSASQSMAVDYFEFTQHTKKDYT